MVIPKEKIENYIPQRPPFVMIDALTEASDAVFKTEYLILPGNIFLENDMLREFALIENIAQSSSAGLALTTKADSKNADGYIGAVSKLKLYKLPLVNETICTTISLLARFENMFLIKAESHASGDKLVECEMKLAGV